MKEYNTSISSSSLPATTTIFVTPHVHNTASSSSHATLNHHSISLLTKHTT
ncbi:hypothetical protein Hanom_Chr15g01362911 [Helianthus anomalus]